MSVRPLRPPSEPQSPLGSPLAGGDACGGGAEVTGFCARGGDACSGDACGGGARVAGFCAGGGDACVADACRGGAGVGGFGASGGDACVCDACGGGAGVSGVGAGGGACVSDACGGGAGVGGFGVGGGDACGDDTCGEGAEGAEAETTVIFADVARRTPKPASAYKRNSYTPGALGIANFSVARSLSVCGTRLRPLRYRQSKKASVPAPAFPRYSPTQSRRFPER